MERDPNAARNAVSFLLSDPYALHIGGHIEHRSVLRDQDIAKKAIEQATVQGFSESDIPVEAGRILYDVFQNMPPDEDPEWTSQGIITVFDGPQKQGRAEIFGAIGTNAALAETFLHHARPEIDTIDSSFALIATSRAWYVKENDPRSTVLVIEALANTLTSESLENFLMSANQAVHTLEDFFKFGELVEDLKNSTTLPKEHAQAALREYNAIAQNLETARILQRRELLVEQARSTANQDLDPQKFAAFIGADGPLPAIQEFDPATAATIELIANAGFIDRYPESEWVSIARQRQDEIIDLIMNVKEENTDFAIPDDMSTALETEMLRRLKDIPASDGLYNTILSQVQSLGLKQPARRIESLRADKLSEERDARERKATLRELGLASYELPPSVEAVDFVMPAGYVAYDTSLPNGSDGVQAVITDLESFFLREDPEQFSDLKDSKTIFQSLKAKLQEWVQSGAIDSSFSYSVRNDDSSFRHSDSSFEDYRIRVKKESNAYRLYIDDFCKEPYALRDFAKHRGRPVDYEGLPKATFSIGLNQNDLKKFAALPAPELPPGYYEPLQHTIPQQIDISSLAQWLSEIFAVPHTQGQSRLQSATHEEAATVVGEGLRVSMRGSNLKIDSGGMVTVHPTVGVQDGTRAVFPPSIELDFDVQALSSDQIRSAVERAGKYRKNARHPKRAQPINL